MTLATDPAPAGVAPESFRRCIAQFATGIAVVGCFDDEDRPHGMTVNSFVSVSLDPPTVLVSLRPGRTHTLVRRRGRYGVSVLGEADEAWSRHFAGRPLEGAAPPWAERAGVPVLRGALAWFACELEPPVQVHDHTLFLARVVACEQRDGMPLMYWASGYRRAAWTV